MQRIAQKLLIPACFLYYLFVAYWSGFFADPEYFLLRFAPDSGEYMAVANWIFHGQPTEMISRRTFFYPLVAGLVQEAWGFWGIWVLQAALWLTSAWLFYQNLTLLVKKPAVRLAIFTGFCLAWTPIQMTLMALTESLVIFLLSGITYLVLRRPNADSWRSSWVAALFLSALLAVTKPNYGPMFYSVVLFIGVSWYFGKVRASGAKLAVAFGLSFLPALTQGLLHNLATGHFGSSNIGQNVMQLNIYSQVQAKLQGREILAVQPEVLKENPDIGTMTRFLAAHPLITVDSILHNFEENIRGVFHLTSEPRPLEEMWRKTLNSAFYWCHILFLLPLLWTLWHSRHMHSEAEFRRVLLGVVFMMSMAPLGLSFWAADRWTAPLLAVWPMLYILVTESVREAHRAAKA